MKNRIAKSLLVFALLLVVVFTFGACAQIDAVLTANLDGTIDEYVKISIDTEEIVAAGLSPIEVRVDILEKAQQTVDIFRSALITKCNNDLETETDPDRVFMLKSFRIDGITQIGGEQWDGKELTVGIRFKNFEVYKYFFDIPDDNETEEFTERHFFYDKIYYYSRNLYSVYSGAGFYSELKTHFESYPEALVSSALNQRTYSYITDSKRQHSDADLIYYTGEGYCHTWIVTDENIDEPIMFYYNVANAENWILLGVAISIGVCIILFGTNAIIEYKNKSKKKKKE